MSAHSSGLRKLLLIAILFVLHARVFAQYPCPGFKDNGEPASRAWLYAIKLQDPGRHLLRVTLSVQPTSPELQVQLPVWNALYQVRDFAQYVNWLRASDAAGNPVPARQLDKMTWAVPNATSVQYEIVAADPGPFGAELNERHAFFNLAQVLVYPAGHTQGQAIVRFEGVPNDWKIATPLQTAPASSSGPSAYCADGYDHLVDSPVEMGTFREFGFEEGGAHYRVVIDSEEDYRPDVILGALRKIVASETGWMQDRPFRQYTFIYHLPHGMGRGGMEHAYSTVIETSAERLADDPLAFEAVTAHEFFHLWNVKRIRPQSLQPIDYTKENYTRALWFSEGVDSTVAEYMLVRAGLLNEEGFLERLAAQVRELESRPAEKTQSVEDSSLDAWLEKYAYYRSAERSVSYYNKGQIVGVLLDLEIRKQSKGTKSLRDLFQWMNVRYARQGKFFDDSEGVRAAAEAITGANFGDFFQRYVSGTAAISYNDFFSTVGLQLDQKRAQVPHAGFTAAPNFGPVPIVMTVDSDSDAERAGLHPGDIILFVNGQEPQPNLDAQIAGLEPGSILKLKVSTRDRVREVKIKLSSREDVEFEFHPTPGATPEQLSRRRAWLHGDAEELP